MGLVEPEFTETDILGPRGSGDTARWRSAAIAYFIYGVIYMTGAAQLGLTGASSRTMASGSWIWYLAGVLMTVGFPWLILKRFKWFTRTLVLLLLYRIYGLSQVAMGPTASEEVPLIGELVLSKSLGAMIFALVAGVTASFLAHAAWGRPPDHDLASLVSADEEPS